MAVFAYLYFNNVVARQTVTVGYMLQKALQLDGSHMLELFTKMGACERPWRLQPSCCTGVHTVADAGSACGPTLRLDRHTSPSVWC